MFVDTHCHLDFLPQPAQQAEQARKQGLGVIVVPAVEPSNFEAVRELPIRSQALATALDFTPVRSMV